MTILGLSLSFCGNDVIFFFRFTPCVRDFLKVYGNEKNNK